MMVALWLIDLAFASSMASTGAAATWWLYCRGDQRKRRLEHNAEVRLIRQVLADSCRLTAQVGVDVHDYGSRIREIDGTLASATAADEAVATAAISTLRKLNGQMQGRLEDAEGKLARQERLLERYSSEARTDPLTGLPNRRVLDEQMARHLAEFSRKGSAFSVVLLDVDRFKRVNDEHGHPAGDAVLRQVARLLEETVRPIDVVSRYGGEEFVVVLPGARLEGANSAADGIRHAVEKAHFSVGEATLQVTLSAGVAEMTPKEAADDLIRRADEALLAAKKAGRNHTYWHDGQTTRPVKSVDGAGVRASAPVPPARTPDLRRLAPPPCILSDVLNSKDFHAIFARRTLEAKASGQSLALILAEVNRYAALVEKHGPRAGEMALHCLAKLLRAASPSPGSVGHYGGSCLAAVLPGATGENARLLAERVRAAVDGCRLPLENGSFQFSAAMSVAPLGAADDELSLLVEVETALAQAAEATSSRVCVGKPVPAP